MSTARQLPIPSEVLRIAEKLEQAGFDTWCVGGAVRDNLLGHDNKDFDLATAATPKDVQQLFRRTVPVGVEHGTVAVLDRDNQQHEVTTFRRDVKTDGRHAEVAFGVSLDDDLARRDFTINAIAYHPLKHEWRDPFDGQADLERKLLRAVGDAHQRFREDYLRILRLLRFAARFRFTVEPDTWAAAKENVDGLAHLSAERVRDEWFKGLDTAQRASELVTLWQELGALAQWLPEVDAARAEAIDALSGDAVLITSTLSSDPEATLRRLKVSNAEVERGRRIAQHRGGEPDPGADADVRRWLSRVGPAADDLVAIAELKDLADAVRRVRDSGAPLTIGDLAVNGNDLMQAGVPQGPELGQTLKRLLDEVLEHPELNTKDELLRRVVP